MNELIDWIQVHPLACAMIARLHPGLAYCQMHSHDRIEMVYHPTGSGWTSTSDGTRYPFSPGDVVIYPPRTLHDQQLTEDGEDIVIQGMATAVLPAIGQQTVVVRAPERSLCAEMLLLTETPLHRTPVQELAASLRVSSLYLRLMELAQSQGAEPARPDGTRHAELAYQRLCSDPDPALRIEDIARQIGISPHYLRHVFRARYGVTLKQFMLQTRIDRVKQMLEHTTLPLKAIAQSCGFDTDRYLCTSFRRMTGLTPGEYRAAR